MRDYGIWGSVSKLECISRSFAQNIHRNYEDLNKPD